MNLRRAQVPNSGLGRLRTSKTKSASSGTPCRKAKDSNRIDIRPSLRPRDALSDQLAQFVNADARRIDDQIGGVRDRFEQFVLLTDGIRSVRVRRGSADAAAAFR